MIHPQPMAAWHGAEWFFFALSNVIIFYFCAPRVVLDVRRWLARGR